MPAPPPHHLTCDDQKLRGVAENRDLEMVSNCSKKRPNSFHIEPRRFRIMPFNFSNS
jgi:hypothetical protein